MPASCRAWEWQAFGDKAWAPGERGLPRGVESPGSRKTSTPDRLLLHQPPVHSMGAQAQGRRHGPGWEGQVSASLLPQASPVVAQSHTVKEHVPLPQQPPEAKAPSLRPLLHLWHPGDTFILDVQATLPLRLSWSSSLPRP